MPRTTPLRGQMALGTSTISSFRLPSTRWPTAARSTSGGRQHVWPTPRRSGFRGSRTRGRFAIDPAVERADHPGEQDEYGHRWTQHPHDTSGDEASDSTTTRHRWHQQTEHQVDDQGTDYGRPPGQVEEDDDQFGQRIGWRRAPHPHPSEATSDGGLAVPEGGSPRRWDVVEGRFPQTAPPT